MLHPFCTEWGCRISIESTQWTSILSRGFVPKASCKKVRDVTAKLRPLSRAGSAYTTKSRWRAYFWGLLNLMEINIKLVAMGRCTFNATYVI
uniref:Uncharacterized protein n=1 Tax=Trichogramma kaykai TaxID=54128 RepID=A0ABD2X6K0_9HYME